MFGRKQEQPQERVSETFAMMEELPMRNYWMAAMASVLLSAILYLSGRRTAALFVGQWPPTFILLALFYRLLRPSEEDTERGMRRAMQRAKAAAR